MDIVLLILLIMLLIALMIVLFQFSLIIWNDIELLGLRVANIIGIAVLSGFLLITIGVVGLLINLFKEIL